MEYKEITYYGVTYKVTERQLTEPLSRKNPCKDCEFTQHDIEYYEQRPEELAWWRAKCAHCQAKFKADEKLVEAEEIRNKENEIKVLSTERRKSATLEKCWYVFERERKQGIRIKNTVIARDYKVCRDTISTQRQRYIAEIVPYIINNDSNNIKEVAEGLHSEYRVSIKEAVKMVKTVKTTKQKKKKNAELTALNPQKLKEPDAELTALNPQQLEEEETTYYKGNTIISREEYEDLLEAIREEQAKLF